MGGNRFELPAGACVASSFGLPYIGQLSDAVPARPYVAVSLDLDINVLASVMLDMPKCDDQWGCPAAKGELKGPVGNAFGRLIGLLAVPGDIDVLAPHYEFELYYRLLQSPMGNTLRQIAQRDHRLRHIKMAADWLAANHNVPIVVADLAASASMSPTSFYRHFKALTGYSPLAFQRHVRLLEAKKLLAAGSASVSQIAYESGYLSPSQFSREYKSMFGISPVADLPGGDGRGSLASSN